MTYIRTSTTVTNLNGALDLEQQAIWAGHQSVGTWNDSSAHFADDHFYNSWTSHRNHDSPHLRLVQGSTSPPALTGA